MAKDTIKASERALVDVFCNKFRFSIPAYQRPYVWTTENTEELFDDLLNAMGTTDNPSEASPYFMGSIVLIKNPEEPGADVVDGQQRLTTLTILICVLRDRLEADLEKNLSREQLRTTAQRYVAEVGDAFAGAQDTYRLQLQPLYADFFRTTIQHMDATNSLPDAEQIRGEAKMRIVENARHLANRVDDIDPDKRRKLLTFMIQRCFLVVVEASDQDSAYRVFSVLNDRGVNLSPTDILKADIIGAINKSERETYTETWEEIEASLGRDRFRDLFAHIRMIHRRTKLAGTLDAEFHTYVLGKDWQKQNPGRAAEFINQTLKPMSDTYLQVVNKDFPGGRWTENINRSLRHLAMLDNFDWQPPTILFLSKFSDQPELVAEFLSAIDALAYGMFICRDSANKRISRYADIIGKIDSGDDVLGDNSPIHLSPERKNEILEQLDGPVYETPQIRRAVLLRLDEAISEVGATYDHKIISIEHVLPQKPAEGSEWMKLFNEEERGYWTHRLANLVLLSRSKNSKVQNYPFEKKKEKYFVSKNGTSTFALTTQVRGADSWTPDYLAVRQKDLLETCRQIWNLHT